MHPTIDVFRAIEFDCIVSSGACLREGKFAIGGASGEITIAHSNGQILDFIQEKGAIRGIVGLDNLAVAACDASGISAIGEDASWHHESVSGAEYITGAGLDVLSVNGAGEAIRLNAEGGLIANFVVGEITHLAASTEGNYLAFGLTDGGILLTDSFGNNLHHSPAAEDDVESISSMIFRSDNTLIVARNSLGVSLDERPENRLECWHVERGLIHTTELPARATTMIATDEGVIVGCFDGRIISLMIGDSAVEISKFDYSITTMAKWNDDILVGSWFDICRLTQNGEILWSLEHQGLVETILLLDDGMVAVLGDDRKGSLPSLVLIIDPDAEPRLIDDRIEIDIETSISASEEFSGTLSEAEETASAERPSIPADAAEILGTLEEELEIQTEEAVVESDLLEDLASSARAINLPPIVDVGEDRTIQADADSTSTVLLDGSRSYDPDGQITAWAWEDKDSRVIGKTAQLRVKLPIGVHAFHLSVTDNRGATSRATLTIRIVESLSDDGY